MFFRLGLFFFLAIAISSAISAAPGDLDTSFDNDGKITVQYQQFIGSPGYRTASAGQADGKILFAVVGVIPILGGSTDGYMIFRYNPNGSLDSTFGTNGIVRTNVGNFEGVGTLLIQPDGKIILTGERYVGATATDFAVLRFNPDGTPDNTFDGNGLAVANIVGVSNERGGFAALQPDGKVIMAGQTDLETNYGSLDWAIVRFNIDGSLDSTFDGDGRLILSLGGIGEYLSSVAIQQDGKIVVSGYSSNGANDDFTTARLNVDGSNDQSFGVGGFAKTPIGTANDSIFDVLVQPDGRILAAGSTFNGVNNDIALARYNSDGSLDTNFGLGGVLIDSTAANDIAYSVAVQADGKIVVITPSGIRSAVIRYSSTGSRDALFGANGYVSTEIFNDYYGVPDALLIQNDGKIVVSGIATRNDFQGPTYFFLLRYLMQGALAMNFDYDGDGRADLSVRRPGDNIWYLLRGTVGYTAIEFGVAGDMMVPADYDGDGKTDVAMFRPSNGTWYIFMSQSQSFQTFSWGANGDLPVPADHDGDGKADLVVFRPSTNTWYSRFANGTFSTTAFGAAGDKPVVGDFDGDGKADIGLYRPSDNNWYILKTGFGFFVQTWGVAGDIPVPADYDGDGATDVAVFRPSTGQWFRIKSTAGFDTVNWGQAGDQPIPADYDGDGKSDVAVFRPSNATWYIVGSTSGQLIQNYGVAGDLPTQGAFIY